MPKSLSNRLLRPGLIAGADGRHFVPAGLDQDTDQTPDRLIVLDDQDAHVRRVSLCMDLANLASASLRVPHGTNGDAGQAAVEGPAPRLSQHFGKNYTLPGLARRLLGALVMAISGSGL